MKVSKVVKIKNQFLQNKINVEMNALAIVEQITNMIDNLEISLIKKIGEKLQLKFVEVCKSIEEIKVENRSIKKRLEFFKEKRKEAKTFFTEVFLIRRRLAESNWKTLIKSSLRSRIK